MKNTLTLLTLLLCIGFSVSAQIIGYSNTTYFSACNSGTNSITPPPSTTPGLSPADNSMPCGVIGTQISDTLYFTNYTTFSGLTVNYLKFDSIYLPAGLCWSTDVANNQFSGGQSGVILIHGVTTAPAGQYKLRIIVDANAGPGGLINLTNQDADALAHLRYRLRINCSSNSCLALNTVDTISAYIADIRSCSGLPVATITPNGSTNLCPGDSVTLTASSGTGYSYQWSTGATTQSIVAKIAGYYYVTVTNISGSSTSNPAVVTVSSSCYGGGYSNTTYFTACNGPTNGITPSAGSNVVFSPADNSMPCIQRGIAVSDTLYFTNYTSFAGLNVNYLKFDSIYLPTGLCWSTNKATNQFSGGESGIILIQGTTQVPAGQYKLRIIVDANAGPGGLINLTNQDAEQLSHLRYRLRVICSGASCPALNTVDTFSSFIPYTTCATLPLANITSNGSTTFCQGDSVILTASSGAGYTYHWSTGATGQSIVVRTAGSYTVTVTSAGNSVVSNPTIVTVNVPQGNYAITASGPTTFCTGGSVTLSAGAGYSSYNWTTGSGQSSISVNTTAIYGVTVVGTDRCRYTDTIYVDANGLTSSQTICIVSVDTGSGKNQIVWEKAIGSNIDSFKIYKETNIAGTYQLIRRQLFANFSTYTDLTSSPAQQSSKYVITAVNSCGESPYSSPHQTIHLTSNLGVGGVVNLLWNDYIGFNYPSFNIYRGSSTQAMQLLATVSSSNLSYTDQTPLSPPLYYQIEVVNPNGCVPSRTNGYNSSLSNVINITQTSINDLNGNQVQVYSYSDENGSSKIHFTEEIKVPVDVKLYDLSGRIVMHQTDWIGSVLPIDANIANGIYIIIIQNGSMSLSHKLQIIR